MDEQKKHEPPLDSTGRYRIMDPDAVGDVSNWWVGLSIWLPIIVIVALVVRSCVGRAAP